MLVKVALKSVTNIKAVGMESMKGDMTLLFGINIGDLAVWNLLPFASKDEKTMTHFPE